MIHVVRHGRTSANAAGLLLGRADPDLDEEGRGQAANIAAAVPSGAIVISSPLRRTRQTAEIIAGDSGHEVDERLVELDYGDLDLTPVAEVGASVWSRWRRDPDFRPANGETLNELAQRMAELLESVADRAVDNDLVLVTHVSPIKAAVAWALGVEIGISWRSQVSQASITRIAVSGHGPALLSFNDVGHLR